MWIVESRKCFCIIKGDSIEKCTIMEKSVRIGIVIDSLNLLLVSLKH